MQATRLPVAHVPMWSVEIDQSPSRRVPFEEISLRTIDRRIPICRFRGLPIHRIAAVVDDGIDVNPRDAPIYVSSFDKAWEYGGLPKLVLAIDPTHLDQTFRTLGPGATIPERQAVSEQFPTVVERSNGELHCSRLRADDPRLGSADEVAYARWIPGDPFAALVAALIVYRPSDADQVVEILGPAMRERPIQRTSNSD